LQQHKRISVIILLNAERLLIAAQEKLLVRGTINSPTNVDDECGAPGVSEESFMGLAVDRTSCAKLVSPKANECTGG
jgi:hypothetical protein